MSEQIKLVALSGGVDSVVLFDILWRRGRWPLMVAHVDHGMRPDSAADARFVQALAAAYGVKAVTTRLELGAGASEDQARQARYAFLHEQAKAHGARLVTAHHRNDVAETIAINLRRGTGWRGLGVLADPRIERPLIDLPKQTIYDYAARYRLEWREDSTNTDHTYLRNHLRQHIRQDDVVMQQLAALRQRQIELRQLIQQEVALLRPVYRSRCWLTMAGQAVAHEVVRYECERQYGHAPLTKQLQRAWTAIRTGRPGARYQLGDGIVLTLTRRHWSVHREGKSVMMKDDRRVRNERKKQ